MDFASRIRTIPDFPVAGILFRDITTLIKDGEAFRESIDALACLVGDLKVDKVAAIEARGWILAAPIAYKLSAGFVPIRKPSKLPGDKISCEYALEYGSNVLELHRDAIEVGETVLLIDDLLATGGTARASIELIERLGGKVAGVAFLVELVDLKGREVLKGYDVRSIVTFAGA
jgi:adenine phosphoribosyltransferase